jgi:hypothetical protein
MKDLEKLKDLVLNELEIFIDENKDEFEFFIDLNNIDYWSFDEEDNSINIDECGSIFIRDKDDLSFESDYNADDFYIVKKVYVDKYALYIVM